MAVTGIYIHPQTKMAFPAMVGGFTRADIIQYAKDEVDVGVGYNLKSFESPVIATVYVYPAPPLTSIGSPASVVEDTRANLFNAAFAQVKREIVAAHPDAKLVEESAFTLTQGSRVFPGRMVEYQLSMPVMGIPVDSLSEAYLFQKDKWLIMYRFTFHPASASASKAAIAEFMQSLAWPP